MCVIIAKKPSAKISTELLEKCWRRNQQGAGFVWVPNKGDNIIMRKGIMKQEDLMKELNDLRRSADGQLIVHFRISSRGAVNENLTHPFDCTHENGKHKRYLFHNGTVRLLQPPANESDSSYLAILLRKLSDESCEALLRNLSAKGFGRFVFISGKNVITIGDNESVSKKGIWLSNTRHEDLKAPIPTVGDGAEDYYGDYESWIEARYPNYRQTYKPTTHPTDDCEFSEDDEPDITGPELIDLIHEVARKTAIQNKIPEDKINDYVNTIISDHDLLDLSQEHLKLLKKLNQKYEHPLLQLYKQVA